VRGLGIHLHARERRERERSGMVDLRAETASLGDKSEFTETKDQSRTHQPAVWVRLYSAETSETGGLMGAGGVCR
jgi:hypothetical protein